MKPAFSGKVPLAPKTPQVPDPGYSVEGPAGDQQPARAASATGPPYTPAHSRYWPASPTPPNAVRYPNGETRPNGPSDCYALASFSFLASAMTFSASMPGSSS
jgi:hypothetical protein